MPRYHIPLLQCHCFLHRLSVLSRSKTGDSLPVTGMGVEFVHNWDEASTLIAMASTLVLEIQGLQTSCVFWVARTHKLARASFGYGGLLFWANSVLIMLSHVIHYIGPCHNCCSARTCSVHSKPIAGSASCAGTPLQGPNDWIYMMVYFCKCHAHRELMYSNRIGLPLDCS